MPVSRRKRWFPKGQACVLPDDGRLHELFDGHYYARRPEWEADGIPLATYFEIVDMFDATGEEEFEDFPIDVEAYVMTACSGPRWMSEADSNGESDSPEEDLSRSFQYGSGVPVTHILIKEIRSPRLSDVFRASDVQWKTVVQTYGTLAAQYGDEPFRYPRFASWEKAKMFVEALLLRVPEMMEHIDDVLDRPINMAGERGIILIEKQAS